MYTVTNWTNKFGIMHNREYRRPKARGAVRVYGDRVWKRIAVCNDCACHWIVNSRPPNDSDYPDRIQVKITSTKSKLHITKIWHESRHSMTHQSCSRGSPIVTDYNPRCPKLRTLRRGKCQIWDVHKLNRIDENHVKFTWNCVRRERRLVQL